ncbi:MAG: hypothetical protein JWP97_1569 [Labilithrix sp.]|nr:hypothetical protein [Labilithrix sp.]
MRASHVPVWCVLRRAPRRWNAPKLTESKRGHARTARFPRTTPGGALTGCCVGTSVA